MDAEPVGPTPSVTLAELLAAPGPVALDGGLATELEDQGHDLSDALWSARLLRDDPAAVEAAHLAFLRAGARVLETASYQASAEAFVAAGLRADEAEVLLARSVLLACRARERFLAERPGAPVPLVAASVGPYGALLAGGQEYTGAYGDVAAADLERFHERRLGTLLAAAPDAVACETIPRADEAAALARVLDRLDAPGAWIAFTCRDGRTTAGGDPIETAVAAATTGRAVVAVGVNCTAPEHVDELLERCAAVTDLPLVAYPNGGRVWDGPARRWSSLGADRLPVAAVRDWVAAGARLVGGCCGLGPVAIEGVAAALAERPPAPS